MQIYQRIFENNRAWVEARTREDPQFFERLAREQNPEILYIGCSDSRIPANVIMGLEPGEVFVHRNVANLVPNLDLNVASVLLYAVNNLKVRHIIVCGHYGCGGIRAALEPCDQGLLSPWLRNIRDVYRLYQDELDAMEEGAARSNRLVELNVTEQVVNVLKHSFVYRSYQKTGYPVVHGCVYSLENGLLKDLQVDTDGILRKVTSVYHGRDV